MLQCDTNTINTKSDTLPLSCFLAFKTLPSLQIHREPFLPCNTGEFIFSLRSNMLNLWSSCNRARAVWSCFSLLPKPAQLQAHRWWNMCMIFVGESPHMNTPVTCELRHHLCGCNMGSFPVCFWSCVIYGSGKTKTAHTPVAKAPQIQHVRRILNMHSPVLHGKGGSGAHAMLMGVAPCTPCVAFSPRSIYTAYDIYIILYNIYIYILIYIIVYIYNCIYIYT